eukprot:SAG31_NODE_836_length_11643_cov_3.389813_13_plen_243_part_00
MFVVVGSCATVWSAARAGGDPSEPGNFLILNYPSEPGTFRFGPHFRTLGATDSPSGSHISGHREGFVGLGYLVCHSPVRKIYRATDCVLFTYIGSFSSFNTLAVLFLLDADNLIFAQFLGEATRVRVEEIGRTELSENDAKLVSLTRQSHAVMLPPAIISAVWTAPPLVKVDLQLAGIIPVLPFIVGWVVELSVRVCAHDRNCIREAAKGVASLVVGLGTFVCFFFFVAGGSYGTTWKHGAS